MRSAPKPKRIDGGEDNNTANVTSFRYRYEYSTRAALLHAAAPAAAAAAAADAVSGEIIKWRVTTNLRVVVCTRSV